MKKQISQLRHNPASSVLGTLVTVLLLVTAPVSTTKSAPNATLEATVTNQVCQNNDFVSVTFTATLSPPVSNVRYQWDFNNDGIFDTRLDANPNVTHVYPDESNHTATVKAVKGTRSATSSVSFATIRCGG